MTNCSTICSRKRSYDTLKKLRTMLGKKRLSNIIVNNNRTRMVLCQIDNPDSIKSPAEGYTTSTGPKAKLTGSVTDIATLLRSTAGLRNAIILREIFGPPRSLQPFDLIGSA